MDQTPEDSQLLEPEIQFAKGLGLARAFAEACAGSQQHGVERHLVEAVAEGEAVAFRQTGGAVKRPAGEFREDGVQRGRIVGRHGKD